MPASALINASAAPAPPRTLACPRPLLESIIQCAADNSADGDGRLNEAHSHLAMSSGAGKIHRVVSSSCHDVSILALLYAMESDLIVSTVCGVSTNLGKQNFLKPLAFIYSASFINCCCSHSAGKQGLLAPLRLHSNVRRVGLSTEIVARDWTRSDDGL